MLRRLPSALLATALICCGPARPEKAEEQKARTESAPEFEIPTGPREAVIRIAVQQVFLRRIPTTVYTLYGDGPLEHSSIAATAPPAAGAPRPTPAPPAVMTTVILDAKEMRDLAALAAVPALIEGNGEKQLGAAATGIQDGPICTVDVRFVSYTRGAVRLGPFERHFVLVAPATAAQMHPEMKGVQAIARLAQAVIQTHKAKEAQR